MMKSVPAKAGMAVLLLATILAWPAGAAEVELYGRLNAAYEYAGQTGTANTYPGRNRVSNNRSVVGVRGSEDLGGGLSAIFQTESSVSLDEGTGTWSSRDSRVGLVTPLGTIFAGNWPTPYCDSTKAMDPFYPTTGGYSSIMGNGTASSASNVSDVRSFDRRQNNSFHYWTPVADGFQFHAAFSANEERTTQRNPRLASFAALGEIGAIKLAIATEQHDDYQAPGKRDRGIKAGASLVLGGTTIGIVYESLEYRTVSGKLTRDATYLSFSHPTGNGALRLGLTHAAAGRGDAKEQIGGLRSGGGTDASQYTLGYEYFLSKRTGIYLYVSRIRNGAAAQYDFAINGESPPLGAGPKVVALGMRTAF